MANYTIWVDSSTEQNEHGKSYGKSTAAWVTRIGNHVIASGLIYFNVTGPNKAIYEGVFAALSQLETDHFYAGGTDKITIYTDSQIVVNQLNGAPAVKLRKHKARFEDWQGKHPNVSFQIFYQGENESRFRIVDSLSRRGRRLIQEIVNR